MLVAPDKFVYVLTDGEQVFGVSVMAECEAGIEQDKAEVATGGNLSWIKACDLPVSNGTLLSVAHNAGPGGVIAGGIGGCFMQGRGEGVASGRH